MTEKKGKRSATTRLALLFLLGAAAVSAVLFRPPEGYRAAFLEIAHPGATPLPAGVETLEDVRKRKEDFVADYFGLRYRGNTADFIDASVYFYGAYEKPEICFMRDTLTAIGPGAVVIDVGANTGLYSLLASKYAKQVHAIEPFPPVLARLRATIAENKIGNITVHAVGLGEKAGELEFFAPPEGNQGTGSFVAGFSEGNRDEHRKLPIVRGDAYFRQEGIERVDFIKMDIEGYEKPALAGLRETLERQRPVVLVEITVHPDLPQRFKSLEELTAAFPENYEFFQMTNRNPFTGAYRLRPFTGPFDDGQYNVVARPIEKAGLVPLMFDGRSPRYP